MSETESTPSIRLPDPSKLIVSNSPHMRSGENIKKIMFLVVAAMLPACIAAVLFFGFAALNVLVLCILSCVLAEEGWNKLMKRPSTWRDGSAILSGILLGMNFNAGAPWWICVLGGILAMILGKQLFGGLGYNPFNPVLVARVGMLIGFPGIMTTWDKPDLGKWAIDGVTAATPLGLAPGETFVKDMLLGNVGGCLGETSAIALIIGGAILLCFKLIKWEVPLSFIGSVFVITAIAHVVNPEVYHSPFVHVFSGGLLFVEQVLESELDGVVDHTGDVQFPAVDADLWHDERRVDSVEVVVRHDERFDTVQLAAELEHRLDGLLAEAG